jgi:ring-1,2-phenylacetyl-CoA epoxidase subunit PaaD
MIQELTKEQVFSWLEEVKDPEIPVLSLLDLGVITKIQLGDPLIVEMTPTFVGCPALDFMKQEVIEVLKKQGIENIVINVSFKEPWTSDRISEKGKAALKKFGIAPPSSAQIFADLEVLGTAQCPRCNGTHTELRNAFGPTLCRSIYYCLDCSEAFEQFKPI